MKTLPISNTYISNAALDATNRVSNITESFRFPGKAVIHLPTAVWRCFRELNKMGTPQEKM
jgi:hypothetical protein